MSQIGLLAPAWEAVEAALPDDWFIGELRRMMDPADGEQWAALAQGPLTNDGGTIRLPTIIGRGEAPHLALTDLAAKLTAAFPHKPRPRRPGSIRGAS